MLAGMLITLVTPTDRPPDFPSEEAASEHFSRFLNTPCVVRVRPRNGTPRTVIVIHGEMS